MHHLQKCATVNNPTFYHHRVLRDVSNKVVYSSSRLVIGQISKNSLKIVSDSLFRFRQFIYKASNGLGRRCNPPDVAILSHSLNCIGARLPFLELQRGDNNWKLLLSSQVARNLKKNLECIRREKQILFLI